MDDLLIPLALLGAFLAIIFLMFAASGFVLGLVIIGDRQAGIVTKRFSFRGQTLPPGQLIALNGEPGLQADLLAPGWHLWKFTWMYSVQKVPVVIISQGEIGLVVASDGTAIPAERILGKTVDCDNYQNARKFLSNGGEKGRQLGILTAGTYRINTQLFTVITAQNAHIHGMSGDDLLVYSVQPDKVGIVTTLDGKSIPEGEIAGLYLPGHDNFQNAQAFLTAGGQRGLQEQVLLSGSWNLNPWFVRVEQVPMTEIPIGYVGVVISYIGKAHMDVSGEGFKHGDLVNVGHKGVWTTPLYPGKHPINTRVMRVELVPTTNIVLNWANRTETHNYDSRLNSITVRSKDGFGFDLDVSQIIHVGAMEASKVISRVGSMQNLVDHVLQPIVGNYFRNAAQNYTVLDFLIARSERQREAAEHILKAVKAYDVEAIDTLIGNINPPEALMHTLTERKIAEEQKKTYEVQQAAQTQRQQLVRETAIADAQQEMVRAERSVQITELQAQSQIKQARGEAEALKLRAASESEATKLRGAGEAESIRLRETVQADALRMRGEAQGSAYKAGVEAIGVEGFTAVQLMQIVGEKRVRIIPEIAVNGTGGSNNVVDALLAVMLREKLPVAKPVTNGKARVES